MCYAQHRFPQVQSVTMTKLFTLFLLFCYNHSFSQDTTGTQEIHAAIETIKKKKFFASNETTEDTLITYCYDFKNKEFFRATCYKRKENQRLDYQALIFDYYFQQNKLIMVTVGKLRGKLFSTYYFKDNRLFKSEENDKLPTMSESELLYKAKSLLSKQQEYLSKSRFG